MNNQRFRRISTCLATASLLFVAGWYIHAWYSQNDNNKLHIVTAPGFHFTNPLLDVELPEGTTFNNGPIQFQDKIESFIEMQLQNGIVQEFSLYYRDLHDGPWFGINDDRAYNPASMMKVPVMIAWLKRAETDPGVLTRTMIYDGVDMDSRQNIRPKYMVSAGKSYTVEELLHYMVNYSDNNAALLLYNDLNTEEINAVLDGTDVDNHINGNYNSITVHGYSGFFRILYNATYLNHDMSEKALSILSYEDFQGIAAGVPAGIMVASKFGEFNEEGFKNRAQLHEFGIVYHPKHPYILGIMTIGNDLEKQREVLRDISRLIYQEVDSSESALSGN